MNKRIKNKINKRIMDKLQNKKEVLTQFEYDYLLKCGPNDLKLMKSNFKNKDGILSIDGTEIIDSEMVYWYADNVIIHHFTNLIDAMDSVGSIDSLRYTLENHEANHTHFNTDETRSILSAGHGKVPKEEPETYFKHIAEVDEEDYEDENSEWLGGMDTTEGSHMVNTIISEKTTPNQSRAAMGLDEIDAEGFDKLYKSSKKVDDTSIIDVTGSVEDDLQLNTDSIEKLDKDILGAKERITITTGVLNAETIDVSNIHLITPESHREIKTTVKGLTYSSTAFSTEEQLKSAVNSIVKEPSKWNKLKGKLKGWFGK